jgi:hypothetical protein
MKTILLAGLSALALIGAAPSGARAMTQDHYSDMTRPPGEMRSDAVWNAALNACYRRTGAKRSQPDTPAFKTCMRGEGWQWEYVVNVPDRNRADERREATSPFRFSTGGGGDADPAPSGPDINASIAADAAANAANAAAQDQFNQAMQQTIQNEVNFNTIYSQGN